MNGTFRDVRKYISQYCFIDGDDGNTYFCHSESVVSKKDWKKYVWNGNRCSFSIEPPYDNGKLDRAINVEPIRMTNPQRVVEREIKREAEKRKEIERQRKEENRQRYERRKQSKDEWTEYCSERTGYVMVVKRKGSDDKWQVVKPCTIYGDYDYAKSVLEKYKHTYKQNTYLMRRCMLNQIGLMCSVKLLSAKNKVGEEIYVGKVCVDLTGKYDW